MFGQLSLSVIPQKPLHSFSTFIFIHEILIPAQLRQLIDFNARDVIEGDGSIKTYSTRFSSHRVPDARLTWKWTTVVVRTRKEELGTKGNDIYIYHSCVSGVCISRCFFSFSLVIMIGIIDILRMIIKDTKL